MTDCGSSMIPENEGESQEPPSLFELLKNNEMGVAWRVKCAATPNRRRNPTDFKQFS